MRPEGDTPAAEPESTYQPDDMAVDDIPVSDMPIDGGAIPMGADGTGDNGEAAVEDLQNTADPAVGYDSAADYDPAVNTSQPVPASLDGEDVTGSETDASIESGSLSSGEGPTAYGDNGESARLPKLKLKLYWFRFGFSFTR